MVDGNKARHGKLADDRPRTMDGSLSRGGERHVGFVSMLVTDGVGKWQEIRDEGKGIGGEGKPNRRIRNALQPPPQT